MFFKHALFAGSLISLALCWTNCTQTETETKIVVVGGPDSGLLAREGKPLELRFYPRFGTDTLKSGRKYRTVGGDSVRLTMARFYVSEISLVDSLGAEKPLIGTYLVDVLDTVAASKGYSSLTLNALPGTYRGLRFRIGVPFDQNHRDPTTQSAPLGTDAGMFWSWNSGYIFHRVEGKVDSAGVECNILYHIGADYRKVQVDLFTLPDPMVVGTVSSLTVSSTGTSVGINAAYDALFSMGLNTSSALKPSMNISERMAHGGGLADRIFLNMQTMFSLRN